MTAAAPAAPSRLPAATVRIVAALSAAQALLGGQLMVHIAFGPLAAAYLASNPLWATAPITVTILTNAIAAAPFALLTARIGPRPTFLIGVAGAAIGAAICAYAIYTDSFALFLAGSIGFGLYQACQNLFRFAAADAAPPDFKPKAMSYVLAGGLAAAFIGPAVGNGFADALAPVPLAGAYAALVALNLIGGVPLLFLERRQSAAAKASGSDSTSDTPAGPRRSLWQALSEPDVGPAILCAMIAYATMTLVMTSTSSAMVGCGHAAGEAMMVIGAHVFAMFAPSFVTGWLITKYGHRAVILTGLGLEALCALVAQTGLGLVPFTVSLVLLGIGWNFAFIGASSLLAARYRQEERARVQAVNEICVFGLMAGASLLSGVLLATLGWNAVTLATLPGLGIAALSLYVRRPREAAPAPA